MEIGAHALCLLRLSLGRRCWRLHAVVLDMVVSCNFKLLAQTLPSCSMSWWADCCLFDVAQPSILCGPIHDTFDHFAHGNPHNPFSSMNFPQCLSNSKSASPHQSSNVASAKSGWTPTRLMKFPSPTLAATSPVCRRMV